MRFFADLPFLFGAFGLQLEATDSTGETAGLTATGPKVGSIGGSAFAFAAALIASVDAGFRSPEFGSDKGRNCDQKAIPALKAAKPTSAARSNGPVGVSCAMQH